MSDNINKMDFKQLRNQVQLLSDQLAIMKRKYEDIIYNLDTDNFSSRFVKEQGDMRTAIEINAEGIKSKVSNEDLENSLSNYSTIEQTADKIATEVKTLAEADAELYSQITQTSSEIKSVVSKNISVKFESSVKPTYSNTTDAEKGMLCEYDGTLYYYNDITETWKVYPYSDGIKSQFLQTADGFELTGDVSISGDAIVGGIVTGAAFKDSGGTAKLCLGADSGSYVGDLNLIRIGDTGAETTIFTVYDNFSSVDLRVFGETFLYSSGSTTYPLGTWVFANADIVWGDNAPDSAGGTVVAVFG